MPENIPLKDYVDAKFDAERRHRDALRAADLAGVQTAFEAANEAVAKHNDLIRKGERDAAMYITRGQVYAALATALVVIGLFIAWFGNAGQ